MPTSLNPAHDAAQEARKKAADAAAEEAEKKLALAYQFAALHCTSKPFFDKSMRLPSGGMVRVRIVFPGVLRVFDPLTGEVLAESIHGRMRQLKPEFVAGLFSFEPRNKRPA